MRVIAGTARGIRLNAPKGRFVRPTMDRVRESLFNILTPHLEDAVFLDLFAGTGANGVEALSRGARESHFVDNDGRSISLISKNLRAAGLNRMGKVHKLTLPSGLQTLGENGLECDVVFADPPYKFAKFRGLFASLVEFSVLKPDGLLIVEHDARVELEEFAAGLSMTRRSDYGDTSLTFFHRPAE